jgi:hypothetical protein
VAKSLALQNEGACGVRQLADSFAHGTVEFEAAWLALADKSGDKSPQSKRCRCRQDGGSTLRFMGRKMRRERPKGIVDSHKSFTKTLPRFGNTRFAFV